jgi:hypothetical protein
MCSAFTPLLCTGSGAISADNSFLAQLRKIFFHDDTERITLCQIWHRVYTVKYNVVRQLHNSLNVAQLRKFFFRTCFQNWYVVTFAENQFGTLPFDPSVSHPSRLLKGDCTTHHPVRPRGAPLSPTSRTSWSNPSVCVTLHAYPLQPFRRTHPIPLAAVTPAPTPVAFVSLCSRPDPGRIGKDFCHRVPCVS